MMRYDRHQLLPGAEEEMGGKWAMKPSRSRSILYERHHKWFNEVIRPSTAANGVKKKGKRLYKLALIDGLYVFSLRQTFVSQ